MKKIQHILLAAGLLAATSVSASIFIDTVEVGHVNNVNDATGYGGVSYVYRIGTHEVTNSQYATFLNAKAATDTYSLYNENMGTHDHGGITRIGSNGSYTYQLRTNMANKPVNFVSFWDAARFTNWLTNGQGDGGTENGVYKLTTEDINDNTITRDTQAWADGGVAIASENEWYKAAYYDGENGSYFDYPTQSNIAPTAEGPTDGNNSANYDRALSTVTDVGAYENSGSYYGTFDQGGNVWEWNNTIISGTSRGVRGGSFDDSGHLYLHSSFKIYSDPSSEDFFIGFRVSSLEAIPEPSAYTAILGCLVLALALTRRKGRA